MKKLENDSIGSIITDPPYGINFMNKKWDYQVPSVEIWKECLRVLKPGGYLLSFAGTRTQHRMACNIEDAGFEIRDMIAWVYGCYSEDTECITNNGWKKYNEILGDDMILQWDHESNNLSWYKPKEILVYDAPDEMVHFENRHTDQLLTKNHRCYINYKKHQRNEFNEGYTVVEAGDIKKHWIKNFPLAGNLEQGSTVNNPYLLGWWMTDAWVHGDGKACMFSQVKPKTLAKLRDALSLADCKFSEYIKERRCFNELHGDEHSFYVTGNLADQFLSDYPTRKFSYEILTWDFNSRMLFLEGLLDGDGSRPINQYNETFWSLDHKRLDVVQALCLSLNIRSYVDYKKGCVYLNRKTNTTQLQCKHTNKVERYSGKVVWCLQTETGAFVVRRNGKAFISGNSGMPKHKSCLKPALEPITMARKPAKKATLLNIDECRVEGRERTDYGLSNSKRSQGNCYSSPTQSVDFDSTKGRYPSNLIHDGSDEVLGLFPDSNGAGKSVPRVKITGYGEGIGTGKSEYLGGGRIPFDSGSGSAARFFYCAKANKKDREEGNNHPTVKPTELMKYLIKLVTPENGTVLDPFMGSGTTGKAAVSLGYSFIGIELDKQYFEIAQNRISKVENQ